MACDERSLSFVAVGIVDVVIKTNSLYYTMTDVGKKVETESIGIILPVPARLFQYFVTGK
jgi:hypothetical protein